MKSLELIVILFHNKANYYCNPGNQNKIGTPIKTISIIIMSFFNGTNEEFGIVLILLGYSQNLGTNLKLRKEKTILRII